MGAYFSAMFGPQSPVEDKHRVIGIRSGGTSVDKYSDDETRIQSLLDWCRNSQSSSHHLLPREFVEVEQGKDDDDSQIAIPFRIMQWNILADALGSGKDNFIKCPKEAISWETRRLHILEEMLTYQPDIICCQEVEVDHFDGFLHKHLKEVGYHGAFLPKPCSPCLAVEPNNGPDGCAIFFRTDKFDLVDYMAVTLKTMTFWTNQVALFHMLRCKQPTNCANKDDTTDPTSHPPGTLLIGTTHLKAKQGYESLRAKQGKDLLSYLAPYAKKGVPIIMCGDFNATSEEEVYKVICDCREPHLESAYSCMGEEYPCGNCVRRKEPPFTTWCIRSHGETPKTVDYLWYSKTDFHVKKILQIPTGEQITVNRLPSFSYPSDHVSLVCDMELKTRCTAKLPDKKKILASHKI